MAIKKVTRSTAQKIRIKADNFDPITVYLEDLAPGRGVATIKCFDDCWAYTWGAIGKDRKIAEFIIDCDEYYLAGKFRTGSPWETDYDAIPQWLKNTVIERRKAGWLTKEYARELFDMIPADIDHSEFGVYEIQDVLYAVDDCWHEGLPRRETYKNRRLREMIVIVQEALKDWR